MTTTTTLRSFRIFGIETGHDFGTWQGKDETDVLIKLAEQAGDLDGEEVELVELTASAFDRKRADATLRMLSPCGILLDGLDADQDWDAGTTTFFFADGSRLVVDDFQARAV